MSFQVPTPFLTQLPSYQNQRVQQGGYSPMPMANPLAGAPQQEQTNPLAAQLQAQGSQKLLGAMGLKLPGMDSSPQTAQPQQGSQIASQLPNAAAQAQQVYPQAYKDGTMINWNQPPTQIGGAMNAAAAGSQMWPQWLLSMFQ